MRPDRSLGYYDQDSENDEYDEYDEDKDDEEDEEKEVVVVEEKGKEEDDEYEYNESDYLDVGGYNNNHNVPNDDDITSYNVENIQSISENSKIQDDNSPSNEGDVLNDFEDPNNLQH